MSSSGPCAHCPALQSFNGICHQPPEIIRACFHRRVSARFVGISTGANTVPTFTKPKTAIFKSPTCRFSHFHVLKSEMLLKLCHGRTKICRHICSRWPKKKFRGSWTDGVTCHEKVFMISHLVVAVKQNGVREK